MDVSFSFLLNNSNLNIIDVRSREKYNNGHIPGAVNIDSYILLSNIDKYLDKNKTYYFYCDYGNKSRIIVDKLSRLGYHAVNVVGGYNNYLFGK